MRFLPDTRTKLTGSARRRQKVGDRVREGDPVAVIEAMKMRRQIHSPLEGVVRSILAREGEVVDINDVLMVVS